MNNSKNFVWFSFFKEVLKIKNINFDFNTFFSESKKKWDKFNIYFTYNDKDILKSSLSNCIFLLKYFEKDFFCLNNFVLKDILKTIDLEELKQKILEKPNSEFLRKIAFLVEKILEIDIKLEENFSIKKNYINILNPEIFITSNSKLNKKCKKYKIIDNSLWEIWKFNPIILKNEIKNEIFTVDFNKNLENINSKFDKEIIKKAITYLYTKETKWSLEIEWEKFSQSKNRWFLKLISDIPLLQKLEKNDIINFHNIIYDSDFSDYRKSQNYIGSWNWMMGENIIEYIPPKSENLDFLMDSLLNFYNKNINELNPILLSTILSTQFVLIHPFMDWNWRHSRFLFQFALLNSWVSLIWKDKIILPVSAFIQLNKWEYYKNLENISKKLFDFIDFEEYENWEIKVLNDTKNVYTNIDFTKISNYFYEVLNKSINIDYKKELDYIKKFYKIYTFIDSNFNISSQNISFITKNILWNNWKLSISKKNILEKKWVDLKILEKIEKDIAKNLD